MDIKWIVPCLLLLLFIPLASARQGPAIAPGCYPVDCSTSKIYQRDFKTATFYVYNFGPKKAFFSMTLEGNISDVALLNTKNFSLGIRRGSECVSSNGCQVVELIINTSDAELGHYKGVIVASTSAGTGGALSVIQQVASRINIDVMLRPTLLDKTKQTIKNAWLTIVKDVRAFWNKNSPAILTILAATLIVFAFYIGKFYYEHRMMSKDWWELMIFNVGDYKIYTMFDYESGSILFSEMHHQGDHLRRILKQEFRRRKPKALAVTKNLECDAHMKDYLKKEGVPLYSISPKDSLVLSFKKALGAELKDVSKESTIIKQRRLNEFVRIYNVKKAELLIVKMIKRRERRSQKK